MSELQKRIQKIQRRETGARMGFGPVTREQPRAMLLIARVADAAGAKAAVSAGADVALVQSADAIAASQVLTGADKKAGAGALLAGLDEAGAAALHEAGCDFAVTTLEGTSAAAVDTDKMGQVVDASKPLDDTTLRALGPMNLDALFVERASGPMTLGDKLALVRLASLSGLPLLVTVDLEVSMQELRALRDAGAAGVVVPEGASADALAALVDRLKAVPAPSKGARKDDVAIVPAARSHGPEDHEDDDDDDGEE